MLDLWMWGSVLPSSQTFLGGEGVASACSKVAHVLSSLGELAHTFFMAPSWNFFLPSDFGSLSPVRWEGMDKPRKPLAIMTSQSTLLWVGLLHFCTQSRRMGLSAWVCHELMLPATKAPSGWPPQAEKLRRNAMTSWLLCSCTCSLCSQDWAEILWGPLRNRGQWENFPSLPDSPSFPKLLLTRVHPS